MITVDSESFLAVVSVAALAALIGGLAGRRVLVPVVAVEIVLGIFVVSGIKLNLTELRDRAALAFFSATRLPLVVAITTIAVERGHMGSGTAASLVTAGILSTMIYPLVGLRQRAHRPVEAAS